MISIPQYCQADNSNAFRYLSNTCNIKCSVVIEFSAKLIITVKCDSVQHSKLLCIALTNSRVQYRSIQPTIIHHSAVK